MHTKKELDALLQEAGINPLKKLGQNFLLNPNICKRIVDAALAFKPSQLIEIGPGLGALTTELQKSGVPLHLVELDKGLIEFWQKQEIPITHTDAMDFNWKACAPFVLVSNLPYNISGPLIMELSKLTNVEAMVLMMQKEVAQKIMCPTNTEDYGILSVTCQTFWDLKQVVDAGPQDFYPVPNVGSRVLSFKAKTVDVDRVKFVEFVRQAFSQRRKKLTSNIHVPREHLVESLKFLNKDENIRAQELSPQQFVDLFNKLRDRRAHGN